MAITESWVKATAQCLARAHNCLLFRKKMDPPHWRFGSRLVYAEADGIPMGIPMGIPNPNQNEIINGFIGLFSIFDSLPGHHPLDDLKRRPCKASSLAGFSVSGVPSSKPHQLGVHPGYGRNAPASNANSGLILVSPTVHL